MKKKQGHIFLVDDNPDMRFYLSDMLTRMDYTVENYENAQAFLNNAMDISPAVLLLDMRMPGLSGLELQTKMLEMGRRTPIIFISGESERDEIIEAFRNGAIDFVLKPFTRERLSSTLEKAMELDRRRYAEFITTDAIRRAFNALSNREKEICLYIVQGMTNKGISEVTGIQPGTAKKHRATIYQKLDVYSGAELIRLCKGVDLTQFMPSPKALSEGTP